MSNKSPEVKSLSLEEQVVVVQAASAANGSIRCSIPEHLHGDAVGFAFGSYCVEAGLSLEEALEIARIGHGMADYMTQKLREAQAAASDDQGDDDTEHA
jgi:hypothetical protein